MIQHLGQRIGGLARRLDDDESGAILLAALAAVMVLIMVGMIIWDAGRAARDKIDVQNAADTAAYSQASVRARTMNMLAFTNVAKRSIVGMHSMYYGMFSAMAIWYAEQCSEGSSVWSGDARYNCERNRRLLSLEGGFGGAWEQLVGQDFRPMQNPMAVRLLIADQMATALQPGNTNNLATQLFGNELMALDDYQRYLVEVTPWWAWTEGLVRATRNGADIATSFPLPGEIDDLSADNWIATSVNSFGNYNFSESKQASNTFDFAVDCPQPIGGESNPAGLLGRPRQPFSLFYGPRPSQASCLPIQPPASNSNPTNLQARNDATRSPLADPAANEVSKNIELHRKRSEVDAHDVGPITSGLSIAASNARPGLSASMPMGGGCFWSMRLGRHLSSSACGSARFPAVPYTLNADTNSAPDLMARSNIIFAYKYTPGRAMNADKNGRVHTAQPGEGERTGGRNLLDSVGYGVDFEDSVTYSTQGYWSMARAEIIYPHTHSNYRDPRQDAAGGLDGLWLWRPGWTAKLRPMALPGEWQALQDSVGYNLNDIYGATGRYLTLAGELGLLENDDKLDDYQEIAQDLVFMEKATRTMDPGVIDGSIK